MADLTDILAAAALGFANPQRGPSLVLDALKQRQAQQAEEEQQAALIEALRQAGFQEPQAQVLSLAPAVAAQAIAQQPIQRRKEEEARFRQSLLKSILSEPPAKDDVAQALQQGAAQALALGQFGTGIRLATEAKKEAIRTKSLKSAKQEAIDTIKGIPLPTREKKKLLGQLKIAGKKSQILSIINKAQSRPEFEVASEIAAGRLKTEADVRAALTARGITGKKQEEFVEQVKPGILDQLKALFTSPAKTINEGAINPSAPIVQQAAPAEPASQPQPQARRVKITTRDGKVFFKLLTPGQVQQAQQLGLKVEDAP